MNISYNLLADLNSETGRLDRRLIKDLIFPKMILTYGKAAMYMYDGLNEDAVLDNWAAELYIYANNLDAIKYALRNLPADKPPNVLQFKAICRMAPRAAALLEDVKITEEDRARAAKILAEAKKKMMGVA